MMNGHPLVLMIDDDMYFREAWKTSLGSEVIFKGFSNPFDFEDAVDQDDNILAADCIIVDFDFGNENSGELDVVSFLKRKNYVGKIFLCSIYEDFGEYDIKLRTDFDQIIGKKPMSWLELKKLITNDSQAS